MNPLTMEYPWYTPYQFAGNKPIYAIDLDGLEEYPAPMYWRNPMDAVVQGVADELEKFGSWVDKTFSWGDETKVTTPISQQKAGNVTTTSGVESKTTTTNSSNFGGILNALKYVDGPVSLDQLPDNKTTTTNTDVYGYNQMILKLKKVLLQLKPQPAKLRLQLKQVLRAR